VVEMTTWSPLYVLLFALNNVITLFMAKRRHHKPTPSRVDSSGLCPTYALPGRILRGPILVLLVCSLGLGALGPLVLIGPGQLLLPSVSRALYHIMGL